MGVARVGMSLVAAVGLVPVTLAVATIWLLLTDPVTVADAVSERDISPLVRELAKRDLRRASQPPQVPLILLKVAAEEIESARSRRSS